MDPAARHRTLALLGIELRALPRDGDGDGFYSPYKGAPDKTPVPFAAVKATAKKPRLRPGDRRPRPAPSSTAEAITALNGDLADKQHLVDAVHSGARRVGTYQLGTHGRSHTDLVDFGNGHEGLVTTYQGADAERHADADQLASSLARSIGIPAPAVLRVAPDRTVSDLVDGSTLAEREAQILNNPRPYELPSELESPTFDKGFYGYAPAVKATEKLQKEDIERQRQEALASHAGLRLGLLDLLLGVDERDSGTIIFGPDGVVPVQSEQAWLHADPRAYKPVLRAQGATPPVQRRVASSNLTTWAAFSEIRSWKDNPLTAADIAYLRERLNAVRPEFEKLDRMPWWRFASDRLDAIAAHAKGTVDLFAGQG